VDLRGSTSPNPQQLGCRRHPRDLSRASSAPTTKPRRCTAPKRIVPASLEIHGSSLHRLQLARPLPGAAASDNPVRADGANRRLMFRPRALSAPRRLAPHRASRAYCIPHPVLGFTRFPTFHPRHPRRSELRKMRAFPSCADTPRSIPLTRSRYASPRPVAFLMFPSVPSPSTPRCLRDRTWRPLAPSKLKPNALQKQHASVTSMVLSAREHALMRMKQPGATNRPVGGCRSNGHPHATALSPRRASQLSSSRARAGSTLPKPAPGKDPTRLASGTNPTDFVEIPRQSRPRLPRLQFPAALFRQSLARWPSSRPYSTGESVASRHRFQ
jgi:hypothetical protein